MNIVTQLELEAVSLVTLGEPPNEGVMIAWVPELAVQERLALSAPHAEPAHRIHLTLAYLGKAAELSDAQRVIAAATIAAYAETFSAFTAKVTGTGLFDTAEDGTAVVALIDAPELPNLYVNLIAALEAVHLPVSHVHGFLPHMTLAYVDGDSPLRAPTPLELVIDNICLVIADVGERYDLKRDNKLAEASCIVMTECQPNLNSLTTGSSGPTS